MTGPLIDPMIDYDKTDESCPLKIFWTYVYGVILFGIAGGLVVWLLCEGISRVMELRGF